MSSQYLIRPLQPEYRQSLLEMVSTAFSEHDPLARSQGIEAADFRNMIEGIIDDFHPSSRLAIVADSGEVAAAVLTEGRVGATEAEGSDAIAALINAARRSYFETASPPATNILDIHFVASAAQHRRRGLVVQLATDCLKAARQQGYRRAIVEAANRNSRTLFTANLGFDEKVLVRYADFRFQDHYPFASIAEHEGLVLLEKSF